MWRLMDQGSHIALPGCFGRGSPIPPRLKDLHSVPGGSRVGSAWAELVSLCKCVVYRCIYLWRICKKCLHLDVNMYMLHAHKSVCTYPYVLNMCTAVYVYLCTSAPFPCHSASSLLPDQRAPEKSARISSSLVTTMANRQ